jgi:hypothetical protein
MCSSNGAVQRGKIEQVGRPFRALMRQTHVEGIMVRWSLIAAFFGTSLTSVIVAASLQGDAKQAIVLREALTFGELHTPRPYILRQNRRENIAVYTPFIRIAMAAHIAKQQGGHVTAESLPAWVTEPTVYVLVRWPCERDVCTSIDGTETFTKDMTPRVSAGRLGGGAPGFDSATQPLWVTTDLSNLRALGELPFDGAVAAAGFAPHVLKPDIDFYAWWRKGIHTLVSSGRLEAAYLQAWR